MGWENNIQSQLEMRWLWKSIPHGVLVCTHDARAEHLKREGYVSLIPRYDAATLNAIQNKFQQYIDDPVRAYPLVAGNHSIGILNAIHAIPELSRLITDEITGIIQDYYGTFFTIRNVNCWRIKHIPGYRSEAIRLAHPSPRGAASG